jgi:sirohydrochlorin cobaltochelatase
VAARNFYAPVFWLNAFADKAVQYKEIVIQSLQVIPGEEYKNVRDSYIKNFANNFYGDLDDEYLSKVKIYLGTPLMAEDDDVDALAKVLYQKTKSKLANGNVVAFMGHGNPEGYDYYGGNIRYLQLEDYLRALSPNYYVGTVDMDETYARDVLNHIAGGTFNYQIGDVTKTITYPANATTKAQLFVLMSIAGDHAHNDMADPDDEESWYSMFNDAGIMTAAYETNFTEACWRQYKSGDAYIPGLAERSAVRKLWMNHTLQAIGKLGTDEALSTPTTAPEE